MSSTMTHEAVVVLTVIDIVALELAKSLEPKDAKIGIEILKTLKRELRKNFKGVKFPNKEVDALKVRIKELEQAHEWISVDDRLPDVGRTVLVVGTDRDYPYADCMQVCGDNTCWNSMWGHTNRYNTVTHWKPIILPQPPEEN